MNRMEKTETEACFNVLGQTAIVTGASSGLGMTFAEALAECGAKVVLVARRIERLERLADDLARKYGAKAIPVKTDVSQESDVLRMIQIAVEHFGSLEILVNNAGIASLSPSVDMSLEE